MKDKFIKHYKSLKDGKYKNWQYDHEGRLALILLCDQYSKYCFSGKP